MTAFAFLLALAIGAVVAYKLRVQVELTRRRSIGRLRARIGLGSTRPLLRQVMVAVRAQVLFTLTRAYVPTEVDVWLAPDDFDPVEPLVPGIERELADGIVQMVEDHQPAAGEARFELQTRPIVRLHRDPAVTAGKPRISCAFNSATALETSILPARHAPAPVAGETARLVSATVVVDGEERQEVHLRDGAHRVGRSRLCEVTIDHPSVSRQHAVISVGHVGAAIEDSDSTNALERDGRRLVRSTPIHDGERIALSRHVALVVRSGCPRVEPQVSA